MSISRHDMGAELLNDVKSKKRMYNQCVGDAREIEKKSTPNWEQCLKLYETAYSLFQTDVKLLKKIENIRSKLHRFVRQPENNLVYDAQVEVYTLTDSKDDFNMPHFVYEKLYVYQRLSMGWFRKKYCQAAREGISNGGILGDDVSKLNRIS